MRPHKRLAALLAIATGALLCTAMPAYAGHPSVIVSPLPGTASALPGTQISFLGAGGGSLGNVVVVGSSSGRHAGHMRSYTSAAGTSFIPNKAFAAGERVSVSATWTPAPGVRRHVGTSFTIATVADRKSVV